MASIVHSKNWIFQYPKCDTSNILCSNNSIPNSILWWILKELSFHWVNRVQIQSFFLVLIFSHLDWIWRFRIQSKYGKIRTRKNSIFGHFSHSVSKSPSNLAFKSEYTILNVFSCNRFVLLLRVLEWNIQISVQWLNCDSMKVFKSIFCLSRLMWLVIQWKELRFLLTILQNLLIFS